MIRVTHVTTTLETGGAEVLLSRFLEGTDRGRFDHDVVALGAMGPQGRRIGAAGWSVRALDASPVSALRAAGLVGAHLRRRRPAVVMTWLAHANVVGGLVARAGGVPVVWTVHNADLSGVPVSRATRWALRASDWLASRVPARIVYTSEQTRRLHEGRGHPADRGVVVLNGVPVPESWPGRSEIRAQLGVPEDALVVGRIGRVEPQKDHDTLLRAMEQVAAVTDARLVLCGRGADARNTSLLAGLRRHGLVERCHLLGERADAHRIVAAFDVSVSSSAYGETSPLVIAESLAVGVPVVTTDVGDSAVVAGPGGVVVPPRDAAALAAALVDVLSWPATAREARGGSGREWVREHYDIRSTVTGYERVLADVAGASTTRRAPR